MRLQDELTLELRTFIDGLFTLGTDRINLAVIASDEQLMDDNLPIYWGLLALAGVYYLLKKLKKS